MSQGSGFEFVPIKDRNGKPTDLLIISVLPAHKEKPTNRICGTNFRAKMKELVAMITCIRTAFPASHSCPLPTAQEPFR